MHVRFISCLSYSINKRMVQPYTLVDTMGLCIVLKKKKKDTDRKISVLMSFVDLILFRLKMYRFSFYFIVFDLFILGYYFFSFSPACTSM